MKKGVHKWTCIINKVYDLAAIGIIETSARKIINSTIKNNAWYQYHGGDCRNMKKVENGFS